MNSNRPTKLDDFVAQEKIKRVVRVLLDAGRKREEPIGHLLLSGPAGLGKTTLARIVASEMGGQLIELVAGSIKTPHDLALRLLGLQQFDVLFLDEIHALNRRLEESLYSAMEDCVIDVEDPNYGNLMRQLGVSTKSASRTRHQLRPFTLVGCTTLPGKVSHPLRSRFRNVLCLEPYTAEELSLIAMDAARRIGFHLEAEAAAEVAKRSRGTARLTVSGVMWLRDFATSSNSALTPPVIDEAFMMRGTDCHGLTDLDRSYLARLLESEEPLGIETLSSLLGEDIETLEESIEPYLMQLGLVSKTARGRVATSKAKEQLSASQEAK